MSGQGVFVDTNILVYAYDADSPVKQHAALGVLTALRDQRRGVVAAQVLAEYFVVVSRRFRSRMSLEDVLTQTRLHGEVFAVCDTTADVVAEALRGVERYQLSYYDAQIWAVAKLNRIPVVLSEDFNCGCTIEGVHFANPFAEGFDLAALLAL